MNSKGITPVVATALLLTIAVSTVITAAVFMEDTLQNVKESIGGDAKDQINEDKADLTIDFGIENGEGDVLLQLRNDGEISYPLIRDGRKTLTLLVDGIPKDWEFIGNKKETLGLQETVKIDTNTEFPSANSQSIEFEVVGPYDTQAEIFCYRESKDDQQC